MRGIIHISPDAWAASRVQAVLAAKREKLASSGILFARSPGNKNHTRAYMAVSSVVDTLRFHRGFALPEDQAKLHREVALGLAQEITASSPDCVILSAHQFGANLIERSELEALRALLAPHCDRIDVIAHVERPSEMLAQHYAMQVLEGRARGLALEGKMLKDKGDWWDKAASTRPRSDPQAGIYPEVQAVPGFIDLARWSGLWQEVFGADHVHLHALSPEVLAAEDVTDHVVGIFDLGLKLGKIDAERRPNLPSEEWLARARSYNDLLLRLLAKRDHIVPRQLWRKMLGEMRLRGTALAPEALRAFDVLLPKDMAKTLGLSKAKGKRSATAPDEPAFTGGFRASQYLLSHLDRIAAATEEERKSKSAALARLSVTAKANEAPTSKSPTHLPPLAQQNYDKLITSPFAPHNKLGRVNEEELAAAYTPARNRTLAPGSTGNVIVGCMKNEAPYIVEWVAYHRAIGVDNFLIYTNGCEDGTSEILDQLQDMGVLQHRNNDDWKGNSPQQHALNQALKEPVIQNAEWIIHIDVDEFMNVRCGNGTLDDFFERVPQATNVAMTWRLFGHNGITNLADEFVIEQFDTCAPKFCPKPHTVWGFKTMFRNIGAYEKISCHRPNKLIKARANDVAWVNGSGLPMEASVKENGWRNSKKSIGYDLLQLNHYALRSAESFLIKRQRGRALHVDRSIGLNYWIRMDWSDFTDITIKRNVPRVREEYDRLMSDPKLAKWHAKGLEWHRAKADELHGIAEFQELYDQAVALKLTETERVAYSLALDMES
ncbi:glycosyltransferase family 2 protein [Roseobacteraceae bacterium S113]